MEPNTGRPMTFMLLGASFGTPNMGVAALTSGTVAAVVNSFPDARIFLLDYGKEPGRYPVQTPKGPVTVELVNIRFSKKFYLRNNIAWLLFLAVIARLVPHRRWRRALLSRNPYLQSVLDADVVASIAGGDSFADIYGLGRLWYVALPQLLVLQLQKPLVLLPQTLGPFKGTFARFIARYIMRNATAVYSRDETGFAEAERLLGSRRDRLKFSRDVAFALEPMAPAADGLAKLPPKRERALVGLNVSGLLLAGGYTRENMFGLKADYVRLMREIILYFVNEENADVLLVPHVYGTDLESDTGACGRLYRELQPVCGEKLHLLPGGFNQHEIKYLIGRCDFFLGSRMHACIAALSQSVPAVCLAYSRKFIGVMESVGCGELVADLCSLSNEETLKAVRNIFSSRTRIREGLRKRMPGVRESVLKLFSPETPAGMRVDGGPFDRNSRERNESATRLAGSSSAMS